MTLSTTEYEGKEDNYEEIECNVYLGRYVHDGISGGLPIEPNQESQVTQAI